MKTFGLESYSLGKYCVKISKKKIEIPFVVRYSKLPYCQKT